MNTTNKGMIELNVDVPISAKDLAVLASDTFHAELIDKAVFRSCVNCDNYVKNDNFCAVYKSNPPPDVIVFSCKTSAWTPQVPF